jgi:hypothetical protein
MTAISFQHAFGKQKRLRLLLGVALGLGLALLLSWLLAAEVLPLASPSPPVTVPAARPAGRQSSPAASKPMLSQSPSAIAEPDGATRQRVNQVLSNLPLRFVPNGGQTNPAVHFTVKGAGHTIFFTPEEVVFSAVEQTADDEAYNSQSAIRSSVVRLRFAGANPRLAVEGLAQMQGVINYLLGNDPARWHFNLPTYQALAYRELYPGVDLVYRGSEGHLKSEFVLAPGTDPSAIVMVYSGMEGLHLRDDGALVLETLLGELIETTPLIYQEVSGVRQEIPGGYVLLDPSPSIPNLQSAIRSRMVGFQVSAYDPSLPLVIDPELVYASYLGGSSQDRGESIAVDDQGSIYVTGWTDSTNFPTTANAIQADQGARDAFVTQIISTGAVYTYGTSSYLGGSSTDYGRGIAVDGEGNVYVLGQTSSSDFPTTTNAIQPAYGGSTDVFVVHIIEAGETYTYAISSYLGGSSFDYSSDIFVDSHGSLYVTGDTGSTDFPTTTNAIQPSHGGGFWDAFVTQITGAGGVYTCSYSSYLGGSSDEEGNGIAVDDDGSAYVTGNTESSDFPTTTLALQPAHGGGLSDAFVTQIVSAGGIYTYGYSSYLGGSDNDWSHGIAVSGDGSIYLTGDTRSSDFPTTTQAIQPVHRGGGWDVFVTQIASAGGAYTYSHSSYLGGSGNDQVYGIAVDGHGSVYVTGNTESSDFPTTTNTMQPGHGGGSVDAFVAQIINAGGIYTYGYSSYLGGSGYDYGYGIAVDSHGNAYVTGNTSSSDFPTTTNALQPGYRGGGDALVAVIFEPRPAIAVEKTANAGSTKVGETITYTYRVTNTGNVSLDPVVAYDDRLGPVTLAATSLAPGISTVGTLAYIVVAGDLPAITNTVTGTGTPPAGPPVTAEASLVLPVSKHHIYLPLVLRDA